MSRQWFLLAVVSLLVLPMVPLGRADEAQPEPPVVEPFDGKLRLNWKILRPDEKRWSLKKNKGKLTIITQRGTIHAQADRNEIKAKNLFLINNPYSRTADFEVSVCISNFTPKQLYQQGGLICYDDDDNYIKFTCEFNNVKGGDMDLVLVRETESSPEHDRVTVPADSKKIWLRLTHRKGNYEYASSTDGKKWTVHGVRTWAREKTPAKIGILAKNGGTDAPQVDVCFEDFRMRSEVPVRKKTD
jgi:cytochrome c